LCKDGDKWLVIDYKTSAFPDVTPDKRQLLAYAYMLYRRGVDLGNIVLILDYVRKDDLITFQVGIDEVKHFEHYLRFISSGIRSLEDELRVHHNMKQISHNSANCMGCPVVGLCDAYRLTLHPSVSGVEPIEMVASEIIDEYKKLDTLASLLEKRLKALKAALILRHEQGDEVVTRSFRLIRGTLQTCPTDKAVHRLLGEILWECADLESFEATRFKQYLTTLLMAFLPEQLPWKSIPPQFQPILEHLKETSSKAPYLRSV
jgi:hypothetical protein